MSVKEWLGPGNKVIRRGSTTFAKGWRGLGHGQFLGEDVQIRL